MRTILALLGYILGGGVVITVIAFGAWHLIHSGDVAPVGPKIISDGTPAKTSCVSHCRHGLVDPSQTKGELNMAKTKSSSKTKARRTTTAPAKAKATAKRSTGTARKTRNISGNNPAT